jgi:hypothetical protein
MCAQLSAMATLYLHIADMAGESNGLSLGRDGAGIKSRLPQLQAASNEDGSQRKAGEPSVVQPGTQKNAFNRAVGGMASVTSKVVGAAKAPFAAIHRSTSAAVIQAEAKVNRRLRRSIMRAKVPAAPTGDAYNPDHILHHMDSHLEISTSLDNAPRVEGSVASVVSTTGCDQSTAVKKPRSSGAIDARNIKPSLFGGGWPSSLSSYISSADEQAASRVAHAEHG